MPYHFQGVQLSFPHPPPPAQYPDNACHIEVFVPFPKNPQLDITAEGNRQWDDEPFLRIPKRYLWSFELPNQNWIPLIRYICYAIVGAKGDLSATQSGVVPPNLATLHSVGANESVYYHSRSSGYLADFRIESNASMTHSSKRDEDFKNQVKERDRFCRFTETPDTLPSCEAAHIVKHCKGDEYIQQLSLHRGGDEQTVDEIDSPANGLLLASHVHNVAGTGAIAFIRTPVPGVLESADLHGNMPEDNGNHPMLTLHYIQWDVYDPRLPLLSIPNIGVHLVTQSDVPLPPCYLFDAVYASHCINKWGNLKFYGDRLAKHSEAYYHGGRAKQGGLDKTGREREEQARATKEKNDNNRTLRAAVRSARGQGTTDRDFSHERAMISDILGFDIGPIKTEADLLATAVLVIPAMHRPRTQNHVPVPSPEVTNK
ncbi:hypothetical protein PQX77_014238, partial [Marasmius sp. AFHP31]